MIKIGWLRLTGSWFLFISLYQRNQRPVRHLVLSRRGEFDYGWVSSEPARVVVIEKAFIFSLNRSRMRIISHSSVPNVASPTISAWWSRGYGVNHFVVLFSSNGHSIKFFWKIRIMPDFFHFAFLFFWHKPFLLLLRVYVSACFCFWHFVDFWSELYSWHIVCRLAIVPTIR